MKKLVGQQLNDAIEKELRAMVREGFDVSPISNKNLYNRLKSKGIISGAISTLTSRKSLIEHYKKTQLDEVGGTLGDSLRNGSTQSRAELIKANATLREQVEESKEQLKQNVDTVIKIITEIKATGIHRNVERTLSPFFLRELERKKLNNIHEEDEEDEEL
ncbi:hypothetical protein D5R81_04860 [Parashewanella spongiae]|uniref:Uncharacterized protein n=1 Tax=Parashewanella spongiae TaxID=342950 RepID=A0A3A6U9D3_9GAMM|nr:hypothetical protein [Parashewanella spongiae]MCL1077273.1 hypothetical protein [Parashewanella spongiae]RJY18546.1 hypothetical protein D5R81_04860 [Parashewanella spongiae]